MTPLGRSPRAKQCEPPPNELRRSAGAFYFAGSPGSGAAGLAAAFRFCCIALRGGGRKRPCNAMKCNATRQRNATKPRRRPAAGGPAVGCGDGPNREGSTGRFWTNSFNNALNLVAPAVPGRRARAGSPEAPEGLGAPTGRSPRDGVGLGEPVTQNHHEG